MLDKFDYEEPRCPLTGGKDFYYPDPDAPQGRVEVDRILDRVDALFAKNDYIEAGRLLVYWRDEARALRDTRGELSMENELVGYYRKQADREQGLRSIERALTLCDVLGQGELPSGATILINCATAYKAFGRAEDALPLFARAEEVYRRTLSPTDERFGGLYNNLATALVELGRFAQAQDAYERALEVMRLAPRGEAECAITYINMAHMFEACGSTDKIADCMQHARTLLHSEALPRDGYLAFVLEKCAPSFAYFGDEQTYREFSKEAEDIYAGT